MLAAAFDRMLARLERAFARQRDFVSDASHELRTPLAVLRAQVELLDRETDEQRRHEGTVTLLRRLDEMDRLVADMLTLASAEAGRLVEPQPIDLADFFEDLRRDLPLFGERDFHLQAVEGTLHADSDRLTQVLRNLVRNAVSHTKPDDRIDVVARVHGERLTISVADSGPGIAPEHLEHVFERFYRAEESRSRDSGGSGLGLAIARAIVEAHGGRIWAESRPASGTTISLELPGYDAGHRPELTAQSAPQRRLTQRQRAPRRRARTDRAARQRRPGGLPRAHVGPSAAASDSAGAALVTDLELELAHLPREHRRPALRRSSARTRRAVRSTIHRSPATGPAVRRPSRGRRPPRVETLQLTRRALRRGRRGR